MVERDTIQIFNSSEYSFKIVCGKAHHTIDPKHSIELHLCDDNSVEVEFVQLPQTVKWNIFKFFGFILGLIFIPILNLFLMEIPNFTDEISPLLVRARYLLKADITQETITLRLTESAYDGQSIKPPKIKFKNAETTLLNESYEINQKNIKDSIFYCIYSISFLVFLGFGLTTVAFININEIAIKIMLAVILFPLLLVPIISTIVSIREKKTHLYELLLTFIEPT